MIKLMEKIAISTENSMKRHLERNEYNEGDVVLLTNLIWKLTLRNQKKELSIKTEIYDIKGVVTNTKHQIFYVGIIEIVNEREEIKAQQVIRMPYVYAIKLN